MATSLGGIGIGYEQAFRALGRVAEKKGLRSICLLELEGGIVLQGQVLKNTSEGYVLTMDTTVFRREELENLMREQGS